MPLQETGVRAEVQDLDVFLSGIKQMNAALGQMAGAITQASGETAKSAPSMDKMGIAMGIVTGGTTALVSGVLSLAGSLASNLLGAINKVTSSITGMAQQGLMLAGRFNEMENAAIAIGRSYGITDDATRESIELLTDAGIRYDVAAQSAAQLIRNQIDLANATDLASIAQATGIIIGADSSETMGRLTHAIATGNTAMLGYMGILVKQQEIEREAQETYGRSIDQLTQQEKMQSRVNAIIKASVPIMGVYGSAMESPTKALRSLTGRELPTLGATMMQTFIPAFKSAVDAARSLVKWLNSAMQEGGVLYPVLVKLGAAASLVTDGIKGLVTSFTTASSTADEMTRKTSQAGRGFVTIREEVTSTGNQILEKVITMAEATVRVAFEWGAGLISAFVEGIASGMQLLVEAMQWIGNVLASWLSPGSPPRIAPELDKWGTEAIGEWLHGMTKADFGVLSDIQGTLSKFLSGTEMRDLSVQLAGALGGGTGIDSSIFDTIAAAAGDFGAEVSTLVKQQLLLARATEMVEAAEERLRQAREAVSTAQENTTKLTKEYNELLKSGAPQDVLDAKLAEINASEDQMDLAQAQVEEAEAAKEEAEAIIDPLQEQVELQKLLVDQLMRLAAEEEKRTQAATKAPTLGKGKGMGAAELADAMMPDPSELGGEITNRISEAIETAKANLQTRLGEIFAPLTTAWEERIQPALTDIGAAWDTLVSIVTGDSDIMNSKLGEVAQYWSERFTAMSELLNRWRAIIMDYVLPAVLEFIDTGLTILAAAWEDILKPAIEVVYNFLQENILPLMSSVAEVLEAVVGKALEALAGLWQNILLPAIQTFTDYVEATVLPILKDLGEKVLPVIERAFDGISKAVGKVTDFLSDLADDIKDLELPDWLTPGSPTPFENALVGVGERLKETSDKYLPKFSSQLNDLANVISNVAMRINTTLIPTLNRLNVIFSNIANAVQRMATVLANSLTPAIVTISNAMSTLAFIIIDPKDGMLSAITRLEWAFGALYSNVLVKVVNKFVQMSETVYNLILLIRTLISEINDIPSIPTPDTGPEPEKNSLPNPVRGALPGTVPTDSYAVAPTGTSASTYTSTNNITFGPIIISSDMSFTEFIARVEKAILAMA